MNTVELFRQIHKNVNEKIYAATIGKGEKPDGTQFANFVNTRISGALDGLKSPEYGKKWNAWLDARTNYFNGVNAGNALDARLQTKIAWGKAIDEIKMTPEYWNGQAALIDAKNMPNPDQAVITDLTNRLSFEEPIISREDCLRNNLVPQGTIPDDAFKAAAKNPAAAEALKNYKAGYLKYYSQPNGAEANLNRLYAQIQNDPEMVNTRNAGKAFNVTKWIPIPVVIGLSYLGEYCYDTISSNTYLQKYESGMTRNITRLIDAKINWGNACENFQSLTHITLEGPKVSDEERKYLAENNSYLQD